MKKYRVTWVIRMSRDVEAKSAREAVEIADDLGDINADTHLISDKKAKLVKN